MIHLPFVHAELSVRRSLLAARSLRRLCLLFLSVASAAFAQVSVVPKSGWTLQYVDSQETSGENAPATNAFDGNTSTYWHSQWQAAKPVLPHEIQINLGAVYNLSGFRCLPRQDGKTNGRIGQYEFYVSSDGTNWGSPVASGTFANSSSEQQVLFVARPANYVRLRALTDQSGTNYRTSLAELTLLQSPPSSLIPQTNWTLRYVDSQETSGENAPATNAFDGSASTYWHSQWSLAKPVLPHEIQINLGGSYAVSGFRYLPRQDGKINGRIGQYEFYVSTDGSTWGSPVATGTFANSASEQEISFVAKTGQYVRLRALTDQSGTNYRTSVAELNVLQSGVSNYPPDGAITFPANDLTVTIGTTISFTSTGSDPDNNTPLIYRWSFGSGSGISDSSSQNPSVTFNNAGTFTVTLTVTDAKGLADTSPATRVVTVQAAQPAVLSRNGWVLSYVDSQETSSILTAGTTGAATNAFDGKPNTMWHSDIDNSRPPPPHSILIDLGAVRNLSGLRYMPRQDGFERGRIGDFEFYTSTTGTWGTPAATGHFANTEDEKEVFITPRQTRYIKLRALNDSVGSLYTAVAELNLYETTATGNTPPASTIALPAGDVTIPTGGSVTFSGAASDPNGHGVFYRWNFGALSGVPDSNDASPGYVRFEKAGVYTVSLEAADAFGLADPNPATRTITVQGGQPLSHASWTLQYVDSQETSAGNYAGTKAIDGDASTYWMTAYSSSTPPPPHEIRIDLGSVQAIKGFTYLPRQDGESNGRIGRYEFYVSADGSTWGSPIATGTFADNGLKKRVFFATRTARYVRLRALNTTEGEPTTAIAEFDVLGASSVTPSVVLLSPRSYSFQTGSTLIATADASLSSGQGVRFQLDSGAKVDVYAAPYTATFTNLSKADHEVDALVIDSFGNPVSGGATHDRAVSVGRGDYYVAVGDSITYGVGDNIVTDNISLDGRNATAGFTPILEDLLSTGRGYPVAVYNEGLPGENSDNGAARVYTLLQKHPDAQCFLLLYGANDAGDGRPSGLGLNAGDSGYAGSFKKYMQEMITAIKGAGKQVALAKAPPFFPLNGTYDKLIQQYNQVVDELVAANSLTVVPPDFHAYFSTRQSTRFIGDNIHPNGLGYQDMANLWYSALTP